MMEKYLQIRLSEDDEELVEDMARRYRLDRSKLIRLLLAYAYSNQPILEIKPTAKKHQIEQA